MHFYRVVAKVLFCAFILPENVYAYVPALLPVLLCGVAGADAVAAYRALVAVETGGSKLRNAVCEKQALEPHTLGAIIPAAPLHLRRGTETNRGISECERTSLHPLPCKILLVERKGLTGSFSFTLYYHLWKTQPKASLLPYEAAHLKQRQIKHFMLPLTYPCC